MAANTAQQDNKLQHQQQQQHQQLPKQFPPLLIKAGLVFSESVPLCELLCKPKLLAIRSAALERLEHLDEQINAKRKKAEQDAAQSGPNGMPLIAETPVPRMDFSTFRG